MSQGSGWLLCAALLCTAGCGDSGTGPHGDSDGKRIAIQFQRLADSVDSAGYSPTAEALRHAAEIVRLTGHATPVTLSIDGKNWGFLAVSEQLDFPNLQCSWPSDSGSTPPGDTTIVQPPDSGGGSAGGGGGGATPLTTEDSIVNPPEPGPPGNCTQVGTYSMRTLIAWEPEKMAEVVRIVADVGSNDVVAATPDVMTGLPTNTSAGGRALTSPSSPNDSVVGGGGGGGGSGGYPGFMGEYLVRDSGSWFAIEGTETNAIEQSGGACTADRASFDWAQFACEAARFRFEFAMRVEPTRFVAPPGPILEGDSLPNPSGESHTLAMGTTQVDGVRLEVVAWNPPPPPVPLPPDSTAAGL
jgi:hypothetical protein